MKHARCCACGSWRSSPRPSSRAGAARHPAAPDQQYRPGWTFTPTSASAETYDTTSSLFGAADGRRTTNDYIATVLPGRRSALRRHAHAGSTSSTPAASSTTTRFSALNRWDQRGEASSCAQQQSATSEVVRSRHRGRCCRAPTSSSSAAFRTARRARRLSTAAAASSTHSTAHRPLTSSVSYQRHQASTDPMPTTKISARRPHLRIDERVAAARWTPASRVGGDYSYSRATWTAIANRSTFHTIRSGDRLRDLARVVV